MWWVTTSLSLRALASSRYGRVCLSWLRSLRLDCLRLGVRNETPEAGYHQRPLLCLPGAAAYRDRSRVVPGVTELL